MIQMKDKAIKEVELKANLKLLRRLVEDTINDIDNEWVTRGQTKDDLWIIGERVGYLQTLLK